MSERVEPEEETRYLAQHSAHDVDEVWARWLALAEKLEWKVLRIHEEEGFPVYALFQIGAEAEAPVEQPGIYLSAGVHGDEPGAVWGLLEWAEKCAGDWVGAPLTIMPCLNPWGLANNVRNNHKGCDLNRAFQDGTVPLVGAWQGVVRAARYRLALNLHEDYDARGIYVYDLDSSELRLGEACLSACETWIGRELRSEVDGNPFERGVFKRPIALDEEIRERLQGGYPESIYLFEHVAEAALTFETPSEFSLWARVQAQRTFVEVALAAVSE